MSPSRTEPDIALFSSLSIKASYASSSPIALLPRLALHEPGTIPPLLFAGNRSLHHAAARAAYAELEMIVPIPGYISDETGVTLSRRKIDSIFKNPHLGRHVRYLSFRHAQTAQTAFEVDPAGLEGQRQDVLDLAVVLIGLCPKLETLIWETGLGVGGGLWKAVSGLGSLKRLEITTPSPHPNPETPAAYPRITPELQLIVPPGLRISTPNLDEAVEEILGGGKARVIGQGGWGLGRAWEGLEVLKLSNLSQAAAKTLIAHLTMLSDRPSALHSLSIGTNFLDLSFMTAIGRLGGQGVLRNLELSTSGTNLKVEGLQEIMSSCRGLESFVLDDVEGRLDKQTWSLIEDWPETLRRIEIRIAESGNHHSWVLHHLQSIHDLPIAQLTHLGIKRVSHPTAELPHPPINITVPSVQAGHALSPIPQNLLEAITSQGGDLEELCLDWWSVDQAEMEAVLKSVPKIRKIQLAVSGATVIRVTTLTTAFSNNADLEELHIVSGPEHQSVAGPPKACASAEELAELPAPLATALADGDSTLPDLRDLRKFVRRLPRLKRIVWTGRGGKGEWTFSKKSPSSLLVNVSFVHKALSSLSCWTACQRPGPTFDFDEAPCTRILEIPPTSSASHADFPALSRSNTNSSIKTLIQTPITGSPVASRRDGRDRRGSTTSPIKSPTIPELDVLAIDCSKRPHARSKSTSELSRNVPLSPKPPGFKTPQIGSTAKDAAAQRRAQREERLKEKEAAKSAREASAAAEVSATAARHIPGSGRTAAAVEKMEKRLRPKTQKVQEYVPIVEEESDGEGYEGGTPPDDGWTTVLKDKANLKKPVHGVVVDGGKKARGKRAKK